MVHDCSIDLHTLGNSLSSVLQDTLWLLCVYRASDGDETESSVSKKHISHGMFPVFCRLKFKHLHGAFRVNTEVPVAVLNIPAE